MTDASRITTAPGRSDGIDPTALLQAEGLCKRFGGVTALDHVHLTVRPGEVVAVVGENGAGKSTLMKILAGIYPPDAGTIRWEGRPLRLASPADAMAVGISLIHQELNLAENLTVVDNLFLGREPTRGGPLHILQRQQMYKQGTALLEQVGLSSRYATRRVERLAPGEKQLVEIARALGLAVRLLIMDEPTSSLTQRETERLYEVIDRLRSRSVAVVYISHRLAEVQRCADRVVVLRDGRNAGELPRAAITHDNMVRLMVGRDLRQYYPRRHRPATPGPVVLRVHQLQYAGGPSHPATLELRAGEVLGMAGLVGAGRTELVEAVCGIRPISNGHIELRGKRLNVRSPRDAVAAGIVLVPEDRRRHGLILEQSIGFNLSLPNLDWLSRWWGIPRRPERQWQQEWMERLRIRASTPRQQVATLSGGNQQKVVYGKWLARKPLVLVLDEPTRGVDVGARAEIYALIDEMAGQGAAVWMISSDMEELLGMSDRVLVMHEGRIAGELTREQMTEEAVMRLATGGPTPPV